MDYLSSIPSTVAVNSVDGCVYARGVFSSRFCGGGGGGGGDGDRHYDRGGGGGRWVSSSAAHYQAQTQPFPPATSRKKNA